MEKVAAEILFREHEDLHIIDFFFKRNGRLIKEFKVYLADNQDHETRQIQQLEKAMDYWDLHCSTLALKGLRP